jgi:hypothetical protein
MELASVKQMEITDFVSLFRMKNDMYSEGQFPLWRRGVMNGGERES